MGQAGGGLPAFHHRSCSCLPSLDKRLVVLDNPLKMSLGGFVSGRPPAVFHCSESRAQSTVCHLLQSQLLQSAMEFAGCRVLNIA